MAALVAALLLLVYFVPTASQAQYTLEDIPAAIEGLMKSTADDAFLVIEIVGTEDFLQLGAHGGPVILDFPLITNRQKKLRNRIETVCADLSLEPTILYSEDGATFLDYDLEQDVAGITAIVEAVLRRVYRVGANTPLFLNANGFDVAPAQARTESDSTSI